MTIPARCMTIPVAEGYRNPLAGHGLRNSSGAPKPFVMLSCLMRGGSDFDDILSPFAKKWRTARSSKRYNRPRTG